MKKLFFNLDFGLAKIEESVETINLKSEAEKASVECKEAKNNLAQAHDAWTLASQRWKLAVKKRRAADALVRTSHTADFRAESAKGKAPATSSSMMPDVLLAPSQES